MSEEAKKAAEEIIAICGDNKELQAFASGVAAGLKAGMAAAGKKEEKEEQA